MSHLLSKSRFIRGLQCEKALYLDTYSPELAVVDAATRAKFVAGRSFEREFKDTFPNAVDVSQQLARRVDRYPALTAQLLQQEGEVTLFEAGFLYNDVLVLADVVHKDALGKIDVYEVKNSTNVSPTFRHDVYVQHYVISHCLSNINSFKLVYRNAQSDLEGAKEPRFCYEELQTEAEQNAEFIASTVEKLKQVLQGIEPSIATGEQCHSPYECPYQGYCNGTQSAQLNLRNIW